MRLQRKLVRPGVEVNDFVHNRLKHLDVIMYQLSLPRSRQTERTFGRSVGRASTMLTAGKRCTRQSEEDPQNDNYSNSAGKLVRPVRARTQMPNDFKKKFMPAMRKVRTIYLSANVPKSTAA